MIKLKKTSKQNFIQWDCAKKKKKTTEFFQYILDDPDKILGQISTKITSLNSRDVNQDDLNSVVNDLSRIFTNAASSTFGFKSNRPHNENFKPWYNNECKKKRDEFNKARNKYHRAKTEHHKIDLKSKAREYKTEMNNSFKSFQQKCEDKLRKTSKTDSKAF